MRGETFICTICHQEHPISECTIFDDSELCEHCLEEETVTCDCCGERVWRDHAESDDTRDLCSRCFEQSYSRCTECGTILHTDDTYYRSYDEEEPYCCSCIRRMQAHKQIQPYGYKPVPVFYGEGLRYLGVELELDDGGESDDSARELMELANEANEHIYCKHDGSLEEGFEIVTHPMTLEYHQNQMPWKSILEKAVQMEYRSHQAGTCGLHVHVNRDSFGCTTEEQEAAIGRILFFVENHWYELLRFSRRTQRQMDQWAARYGRKDTPKEQIDHVKKQYSDRYRAVNLSNSATIEFRMFRGTLRYHTLIATLQLVDELCEVATFLSDEEMEHLTWSEFVARIDRLDHPELSRYLKERRLYINEPVESEVEL